jgi:hypothetical protein
MQMAGKFRYRVDSRKTIFTRTIEEAREYARTHKPAVILERVENEGQFQRGQRFRWTRKRAICYDAVQLAF